MSIVLTLLLYLSTLYYVSALPAQHKKLCMNVLAVNCFNEYMTSENEEICASNGVRYLNKCLFVQAKCKDPSIKEELNLDKCEPTDVYGNNSGRKTALSVGENVPEIKPTLTPPSEKDTFCDNKTPCPDTLDPLCGSNYIFYLNICEFKKAKCKNEELYLLSSLDYC